MSKGRVGELLLLLGVTVTIACAEGAPQDDPGGVETRQEPATPAPGVGLPATDAGGGSSGSAPEAGGGSSSGGASSGGASSGGSSSGGSSSGGSSSGGSSSGGSSSGGGVDAGSSSGGATPGGDCPAGDLTYYYKAVQELAGPTPKDCPCNAATCCYGGLVCVPL